VDLFDRSAENRINQRRVIHVVIDLRGVLIHLGTTLRTNHPAVRHVPGPPIILSRSAFQDDPENNVAILQAKLPLPARDVAMPRCPSLAHTGG